MTQYKEKHIFEAAEQYAQYWHSNVKYSRKTKDYSVQYHTITPNNHNYRSVFTADRDRIMYTSCFLRLSSKTQIFRAGNNDHLRTRLTHTLEVSQIARTIATELGLNLELTEAIALGHDVGHTPFGHAGERQLNDISQEQLRNLKTKAFKCNDSPIIDCNGFKHNQQSVRVLVDFSHGISLTNFCLYGIRNHSSLIYKDTKKESMSFYKRYDNYCSYQEGDGREIFPSWSFEAAVVYWADEIAQRHHDIEDAYRCRLISENEIIEFLNGLLSYFKDKNPQYLNPEYNNYCQEEHFAEKFQALKSSKNNYEQFSRRLSSFVVDFYVSAIIRELLYCMDKISTQLSVEINSRDDFVKSYLDLNETEIFGILKLDGNSTFVDVDKLFQSKLQNIILPSYDVQRQDGKGQFITRKLVNAYITNPQQLPDDFLNRIFKHELPRCLKQDQIAEVRLKLKRKVFPDDFQVWNTVHSRNALDILSETSSGYELIYPLIFRTIFDYISGMTDLFAQEEYAKLY